MPRVYCIHTELEIRHIPNIPISKHIKMALKNNLTDNDCLSSEHWKLLSIKLIKNLSNIQRTECQNYWTVFETCLCLEHIHLHLLGEDYKLISYKFKEHISNSCIIINIPFLDNKKFLIKINDEVMFYEVKTKKTFIASVTNIEGKDITLKVNYPKIITMLKNNNFHICIGNTNDWSLRCCYYALQFMNAYSINRILYPQLKVDSMNLKFDIEYKNTKTLINEQQWQAVMKILNKTAYPAPYIIFGPPGTGKTATLIETIYQITKNRLMENILICTTSNAVADEITIKLMENIPTNIIHRLYASSLKWDINKKIEKCIDYNLGFPSKHIIKKKIVITTLVTSIRLSNIILNDHFSYIIIDEASRAIEPEILIPFLFAINKDESNSTEFQTQIVLAGDPYQLGPVVHCKGIQHLLGKSILERLMDDCEPYKKENGKYNSNYVTKLIKNYRSNEHILHVSNKLFYDNELEVCENVDTYIPFNWSMLPNKNFPMIFQEILGIEKKSEDHSVYNIVEALVVIQYVQTLIGTKLGEHMICEKDIGIITPFTQQELIIFDLLRKKNWKNIHVGTIEKFQGQERTVIILSTVRSKTLKYDKGHIGFLSNPKRFNVAITRAKVLMIIIGNPNIICKNKYWNELWEYCKKHNGYITFKQYLSNPNFIVNLENIHRNDSDNSSSESTVSFDNNLSIIDQQTVSSSDTVKDKSKKDENENKEDEDESKGDEDESKKDEDETKKTETSNMNLDIIKQFYLL